MEEIFVDLRKYDLCNELKKDYISIDELLNILEDKIYELFAKSMGKDTDKTSDVKFILTEKIDNSYFEKENL